MVKRTTVVLVAAFALASWQVFGTEVVTPETAGLAVRVEFPTSGPVFTLDNGVVVQQSNRDTILAAREGGGLIAPGFLIISGHQSHGPWIIELALTGNRPNPPPGPPQPCYMIQLDAFDRSDSVELVINHGDDRSGARAGWRVRLPKAADFSYALGGSEVRNGAYLPPIGFCLNARGEVASTLSQ